MSPTTKFLKLEGEHGTRLHVAFSGNLAHPFEVPAAAAAAFISVNSVRKRKK